MNGIIIIINICLNTEKEIKTLKYIVTLTLPEFTMKIAYLKTNSSVMIYVIHCTRSNSYLRTLQILYNIILAIYNFAL
jgi:hypothetical protein